MKNILIVNRPENNCGIHQYGINIYDALNKSYENKYSYLETNNHINLLNYLDNNNIDIIIFNWYKPIMNWVNNDLLNQLINYKKYIIYHDGEYPNFENLNGVLFNDPTYKTDNIYQYNIGRCLFDYTRSINKLDNIVISSFGFPFLDKGFHKLLNKVNHEFTNVTVRYHLPFANIDKHNILRNQTFYEINKFNTSKNNLIISDNYLNNEELLDWLSESSINCFYYDNKKSLGISSVIDYALSVNVPIGITNCDMFRHIYSEDIDLDKQNIIDIIDKDLSPLLKYKQNWSNNNFVINFDSVFKNN